jgi:hypothetical protein
VLQRSKNRKRQKISRPHPLGRWSVGDTGSSHWRAAHLEVATSRVPVISLYFLEEESVYSCMATG